VTQTATLRAMCRSPLGTQCTGPEGILWGFFDREDAETSGFTDLPRTVSRLDRITVFRIPTADLGVIARNALLDFPEQPNHPLPTTYRVQELREDEDGLVMKLYLVKVVT
jgi:hypothetical protein